MKVLIISDTHGRHENLKTVLKREGPLDFAIHLGDSEGCEKYIEKLLKCPLLIVAGNCDFFSDLEQEIEYEIGNYRALITHGHYYCVNAGIENILREAKGRDLNLVLFGHTHRPLIEYGKDVIALNPGSLSYPRQEGKEPSYIVMEIDGEGKARFEIKYL